MKEELIFGQKVAQALGPGWTAGTKENRNNTVYLLKDGVERMYLKGDYWYSWEDSERIEVHGIYPRFNEQPVLNWYRGNRVPVITCAKSRGPEAVARDISRRFSPKFWHYVEEAESLIERYIQVADQRFNNAIEIAAVLGVEFKVPDNPRPYDELTVSLGRYSQNHANGSVKVREDSYTFEIRNCPVELGLEIARLIARHRR